MIRRLNYTGRKKIPLDRVEITLGNQNSVKTFSASFNFDGMDLPSSARIYVEPNFKGIYQRFEYGTIAKPEAPSSVLLNELPDTDILYFDVSVVDESSDIGRILAQAKGIAVSGYSKTSNSTPLLYVNPSENLGHQFWKLSFDTSDDGRPLLEINKNVPDLYEFAKNDIKFISLVYPAVFRLILEKILAEQDIDGAPEWVNQWIIFIKSILGVNYFPEFSESETLTPEQEDWIDNCVNQFCIKFSLFEKYFN